jgi:hypothetical protein
MKKLQTTYGMSLLFALLWVMSASVCAKTIKLHDTEQIRDADAVNQVIDKLSASVMACVEHNGGKTKGCICMDECSCKFKREYRAVKVAFIHALKQHPEWAGNVVFYQKNNDPNGYSISFSKSMQQQFKLTCKNKKGQ